MRPMQPPTPTRLPSTTTQASTPTQLPTQTQPHNAETPLESLQMDRERTTNISHSVRSENRGESSVRKKNRSENSKNRYTLIHKPKLSILNNYKEKWLDLVRKTKHTRYQGSNLGDRLIGAAMAMVPKAGCAGFSTALSIAMAGVLENLGIPANNVSFLPGKDKVGELLTKRAVNSIIEVQEFI